MPNLTTEDLEPGQFLLFRSPTRASLAAMTERHGELQGFTPDEAVCLNQLIGGLDGSGYVHVAIVSSTAGGVQVVDQSMPNVRERSLADRCVPYGGQDALVLQLRNPNKRGPAAAAAAARADEGELYPFGIEAMSFQAFVLRARSLMNADNESAIATVEALATHAAEELGQTCASLAAMVLEDVGYPPVSDNERLPVDFQPDEECDDSTTQAFIKLGAFTGMTREHSTTLADFVRTGTGFDELLDPLTELLEQDYDNPLLQSLIDQLRALAENAAAGVVALWTPKDLIDSPFLEEVGELRGWC